MSIIEDALNRLDETDAKPENSKQSVSNKTATTVAIQTPISWIMIVVVLLLILIVLVWHFVGNTDMATTISKQSLSQSKFITVTSSPDSSLADTNIIQPSDAPSDTVDTVVMDEEKEVNIHPIKTVKKQQQQVIIATNQEKEADNTQAKQNKNQDTTINNTTTAEMQALLDKVSSLEQKMQQQQALLEQQQQLEQEAEKQQQARQQVEQELQQQKLIKQQLELQAQQQQLEQTVKKQPLIQGTPALKLPSQPLAILELDWLAKGKQVLQQQGLEQAIQYWEQTLLAQPAEDIMLLTGVYHKKTYVLAQLQQLQSYPFLVITAEHKQRESYFVLVYPQASQLEQVRSQLKQLLDLTVVRGNSVSRIITRMQDHWAKQKQQQQRATSKVTEQTQAVVVMKAATVNTMNKSDLQADYVLEFNNSNTSTSESEASNANYTLEFPDENSNPVTEITTTKAVAIDLEQVKRFVQAKQYQLAKQQLQPLFDQNQSPSNWEAWFWMGTIHLALREIDLAETYMSQAIARQGNSAQAWIQYAIIAQEQQQHKKALFRLQQAQRLARYSPEVYLNMGFSYQVLKDMKNAKKAYQTFLALTEGKNQYLQQRLQVLEQLQRLSPTL